MPKLKGHCVPFVPTPQIVVEKMLEMANLNGDDHLIDLGCGDGRVVITAAKKYGVRALGIDLDPDRVAEARQNASESGVSDKVNFNQQNFFDTDLSQATVVTIYLLQSVNLQLRSALLKLKPGTRIVSHDFSMGAWAPEKLAYIESKEKYSGLGGTSRVYAWTVPANPLDLKEYDSMNAYTVNGKEVDLAKALPINIGVFKALARTGIDIRKVETGDFLAVMALALVVMQRANPDITEADFDMMSQKETLDVVAFIKDAQQVVDRPTSAGSTPSTTDTSGSPETKTDTLQPSSAS